MELRFCLAPAEYIAVTRPPRRGGKRIRKDSMADASPLRDEETTSMAGRLGIVAGLLVVLLVLLLPRTTSAFFLQRFVLPKASAALNANHRSRTLPSAVSRLCCANLKVQQPALNRSSPRRRFAPLQPRGHPRRAHQSGRSRLSYHGQPVRSADGSSNLEPHHRLRQVRPSGGKEIRSGQTAQHFHASSDELGKFAITTATVRSSLQHPGGGLTLAELSNVNLTLDN